MLRKPVHLHRTNISLPLSGPLCLWLPSQDAPLLLLSPPPHSDVVYSPSTINNKQLRRQPPSPCKRSRFGIHEVLESRLTSATRLFMASAVTSSADLLPGRTWVQAQQEQSSVSPHHWCCPHRASRGTEANRQTRCLCCQRGTGRERAPSTQHCGQR